MAAPTPSPTAFYEATVPELVEARLAAAIHGIDITFEPGLAATGTLFLAHPREMEVTFSTKILHACKGTAPEQA